MEKPSISERLEALKASAPVQPLSDTIASQLRCNLVNISIKYQISFQDYRLLGEWLGCYQYVKPADRILLGDIAHELLMHAQVQRAKDVMKVWLLCDLIESTLTLDEQRKILKWIPDYSS